jgi:hypothetical protein
LQPFFFSQNKYTQSQQNGPTNKQKEEQHPATVASSRNKGSGCNVATAGSQATTWAVLIRKDGKRLERKSLGTTTTTTTDGLRTGAAANWSLNLDTMAGWMGGGGGGRGGEGNHQWMIIIIVGQMKQTRAIIKYCKVF